MKTIFSLLFLSTVIVSYSQNLNNRNQDQQQMNESNYNPSLDNNMGNKSNPIQIVSLDNNGGAGPNVFNQRQRNPSSRVNKVSNKQQQVSVSNDNGNRRSNGNSIQEEQTQIVIDNVDQISQVPIQKQTQNKEANEEKEAPQINLNLNVNLNLPTINLNRAKEKEVKEEKVAPKKLDDFRIKTGSNSSSGGTSHKSKKEKRSFAKKVVKPIKCWMQRTFKHNTKFHFSCECFKF